MVHVVHFYLYMLPITVHVFWTEKGGLYQDCIHGRVPVDHHHYSMIKINTSGLDPGLPALCIK